METKTIEVIVGKEPTGGPSAGEAGKGTPTKPKEDAGAEVSGRSTHQFRLMECRNCGGVWWIIYDPEMYNRYTCPYCGSDNYL